MLLNPLQKIPRWSRRLIYVLLFLLLIFIFKGKIYRACVSYKLIRPRKEIPFAIRNHPSKDEKDAPEIIDQSLDKTAQFLSFTTEHCPTEVADLTNGGKTNCIGYANLCAYYCNNELSENGLSVFYKAEPYVAQLYLFGVNIHSFFSSPFWKDHDIVVITQKTNGEKTLADPALYDYAGIGIIREKK
jgi:hypothetical protein